MHVRLDTPPLPLLVPGHVFDAYGWCAPDWLDWRRPSTTFDAQQPIGADNPPRMIFVLHEDGGMVGLPRELAELHLPGVAPPGTWALAPYAIDDATDGLFAARRRPRDELWLATDGLSGLFWGLHDWAHFHNHGPFDEVAFTELQCDVSALTWLRLNARRVGIDAATWERARASVEAIASERFHLEGKDDVLARRLIQASADWPFDRERA